GPDDAADEVELVLLQHLVGQLLAHVRLALVVTVDDLGLHPPDLAAEVIQGQLDRVLHVLADDTGRAGQRRDEADLQRVGRPRRADQQSSDESEKNRSSECAHGGLLYVEPVRSKPANWWRDSSMADPSSP